MCYFITWVKYSFQSSAPGTFFFTIQVNIGVYKKNEQYNDQLTDILELAHKYVPGNDNENSDATNLTPTLFLGDYLTFERAKEASRGKRNSPNDSKQLKGLVPGVTEFHNQAELLKVYHHCIYIYIDQQYKFLVTI